jgi:3-oxoadipate enol-lactonase
MKQSHDSREAIVRFFFALIFTLLPTLALAAPQTATLNGAQISFEICGDEKAAPVVLLHDGLANSALWDEVWPALCAQYRVVRYDRRGYGGSPPAKVSHSPGDDLLAVMKHVGFTHAHLIGAFGGAGLAIDFLIDYPEWADRLVLATPSLAGIRTSEGMIARLQKVEEPLRKGDFEGAIAAIAADPHFMAPDSAAAREKLTAILKASPGDLGEHPRQRRRSDTAQFLREIYAPSLIIVGANDDPFNHAVAAAMQKEMRNAGLQVILDAGHLHYLENPGAFVGMVTGFLK